MASLFSIIKKKVVTVGTKGSIFEGFNDKSIQDAIEYAALNGINRVVFSEGTFLINKSIKLLDGIHLKGEGKKTIIKKCPAYRLVAEPIRNSVINEVTVKRGDDFQVGMEISFFLPNVLYRNRVPIRRIVSKIEDRLILDKPLDFRDYLENKMEENFCLKNVVITSVFSLIKGKNIKDVLIENIVIDGNDEENPQIESWWDAGIEFQRVNNSVIRNSFLHHFSGSAIMLSESHDVIIENCKIYNSAKMSIHIGNGSLRTIVKGNIVANGKHDGIYLCHNIKGGIYENNVVYGHRLAGISIGFQDADNYFANNKVYKNSFYGIRYREEGEISTKNNAFVKNIVENNTPGDILLFGRDQMNTVITNPSLSQFPDIFDEY